MLGILMYSESTVFKHIKKKFFDLYLHYKKYHLGNIP